MLHIPRRCISPGATYSLALHIPLRNIFLGAIYPQALHIPGAIYRPALHIPQRYYSPRYISPGATYPRRYITPGTALHKSWLYISLSVTYPLELYVPLGFILYGGYLKYFIHVALFLGVPIKHQLEKNAFKILLDVGLSRI